MTVILKTTMPCYMLSQRGLITEQIIFVLHPSLCLLDWFPSKIFWLNTTQQSTCLPTTPLLLASNLKIFTAEQKRFCLVISNSGRKHSSHSLCHELACSSFYNISLLSAANPSSYSQAMVSKVPSICINVPFCFEAIKQHSRGSLAICMMYLWSGA